MKLDTSTLLTPAPPSHTPAWRPIEPVASAIDEILVYNARAAEDSHRVVGPTRLHRWLQAQGHPLTVSVTSLARYMQVRARELAGEQTGPQ